MHSDILTIHKKHNGARQLIQLCCQNPSQHHALSEREGAWVRGPNAHNATRRTPSVTERGYERVGTPLEQTRVGPTRRNGQPEKPRPMGAPGGDAETESGAPQERTRGRGGSLGRALEERSPGSPSVPRAVSPRVSFPDSRVRVLPPPCAGLVEHSQCSNNLVTLELPPFVPRLVRCAPNCLCE